MRATGQAHSLTGQLSENERRLVAARAILGEWLGGSGGGWQDSGGVWPGIKLIQGVKAVKGRLAYTALPGKDPMFKAGIGGKLREAEICQIFTSPQKVRRGI